MLGSSLGWTYGFPLGQPEVFSLSAQSLAFSFSQRDYVRSARKSLKSAQLQLKDTRQQVILDAALDYIELAKVDQQIAALDQESGYAQKLIEIEDQRVDAGRDSKIELTRARLTAAQVALKRIHLLDQADLLRARLAHLTGLNPADLTPDPETIPPPKVPDQNGNLDSAVTSANGGVQAAYAAATIQTLYGLRRLPPKRPADRHFRGQLWPIFYISTTMRSITCTSRQTTSALGFRSIFPFSTRRAGPRPRDRAQTPLTRRRRRMLLRDQTSEQVLQLQKSLAELAAQEQVAEIQNELAQDQLQAVTAELQSGTGNPQASPLTPKDRTAGAAQRARPICQHA